ncbi:hypothetical protein NA56DRAFT_749087 [Hyaloscypha hepaticicola]|uniref:Uncharacterized protein n=1 Tax=Hyaloscypha hepaticicola TaxID=2082293 RepID=A0A2J6Q4F3_9HELO|nr:hypothetical protein NA56DRAFT_749087 [Hyaloscypha hepaticicola]
MVSSSVYLVSILGFAIKATAQCVTAGYVPCLVPGSGGAVAPPPISPYGGGSFGGGGSGFWSSIQGVASSPIQKRDLDTRSPAEDGYDGYTEIEKRQNSLCCRPAPVECLYTDGIPFCYNPTTTRLFFSDGSYAFISNDTYYGSDGTFIDYKTGIYQYPNGTVVDFTPSSAATTSAGGSAATATGSTPQGTETGTSATGGTGGTGTTAGSGSSPSASKSAGGKVENASGVLVAMFGLMAAFF